MRVMGIDPGLQACGWGVIDVDGSRHRPVACGTVHTDSHAALSDRLLTLNTELAAILRTWTPDHVAVEQTFVNRDGAGTLKLGQARGVVVLTVAQAGHRVGEYAPNAVKKAVVGVGHADKVQVQHMVRMQLPGADFDSADAADALAIALCHAFHVRNSGRLEAAMAR